MSFGEPWGSSFYDGGAGLSLEVGSVWDVAIGGHGYMLDTAPDDGPIRNRDIPVQRNQADTSDEPGGQSLTTEDSWRRATISWHHGAGQVFLDRPASDRDRFRSSKNVDVWTENQLSLLPATASKRTSANTNLTLLPVGSRLYLVDGTSVLYTTDVTVGSPTWTAVTGGPGVAATSITTDGFNVYIAFGASRIYRTDTSSSAMTAYISTGNPVDLVAFVKGRLMAAYQGNVYNLTASGALPAPLFTHPAGTGFTWVGFAETAGHILMAGFAGDKSYVYRTSIVPDGTSLGVPVQAGELPDGEIVRAIQGYLQNYVEVGTDKGVRFATTDSAGNLVLGKLIATPNAVRCFEPQDRFVWFGLTNYDTVSTGLGRLDLSVFTQPLTPAWASDLMADVQGAVLSVVTFQNRRVFTVSGQGVYAESSSKAATGTLDSGLITYNIPDTKNGLFYDLRFQPLAGSVAASVAADSGSFVALSGSAAAGATQASLQVGQRLAETFETRLSLTRSATDTTIGPVVTRTTLRAYPAPGIGETYDIYLLFHEVVTTRSGDRPVDIEGEKAYLKGLRSDRVATTFQFGAQSESVLVDYLDWHGQHVTDDGSTWNGILAVRLKKVL